jgi:cellulose synthase/poly-beta-1,6-N-acetylglucosamine synthase-like glycosyltransferase
MGDGVIDSLGYLGTYAFLASVAIGLWVIFGYPITLRIWCALRTPKPVKKEFVPRTVSVVMPVYNGEQFLKKKLEWILGLDYPKDKMQILVIDDGSTDRTPQIAAEFADRGVECITVPNAGKSAALNVGIQRSTGEILFFTDVRQELEPDALRNLVEYFADETVGVVSGELIIQEGETHHEANIGLYWRYEKSIRRRLSRLDSTLGATGCIYAMRRSLAVPVPADVLVDDMFLPLAAFFKGYRILFDENAKAYDYPTALRSEFRRKVRTLAGNWQLLRYYPQLVLPTNRMWVHFLSHKLGRCLMPLGLIGIAVTTPFLPHPYVWIAGGGQAAFYGLAVLGGFLDHESALKRLTSLPRTFVVFALAALMAFQIMLPGKRKLWTTTTVKVSPAPPSA